MQPPQMGISRAAQRNHNQENDNHIDPNRISAQVLSAPSQTHVNQMESKKSIGVLSLQRDFKEIAINALVKQCDRELIQG